jgi:hypothetical protein
LSPTVFYVNGNVGIGTTDPGAKLDIKGGGVVVGNPSGGNKGTGTINAEKIYVNGSEVGKGSFIKNQSRPFLNNSIQHNNFCQNCPAKLKILKLKNPSFCVYYKYW